MIDADTAQELDEVVTGLPVWPMMETTIAPLTRLADRSQAVLAIRERLVKERARAPAP